MIESHLARRHVEYGWTLVVLAGALFVVGLIAGWVALCGAGIVVTAEELFARRAAYTETDQL
jgi:hypothetical protein